VRGRWAPADSEKSGKRAPRRILPALFTEFRRSLIFCEGRLTFVRTNALLSCAWPGITGGRYFWTHTAYMKTTDFSSTGQLLLQWTNRVKQGYTEDILLHGHRLIDPTTGGVVTTQTFTTPQACEQDAAPNFSLLMAGRWKFVAADGSRGYHLHRYPIDGSWTDGNDLTDAAHSQLLAVAGAMYLPGKIYSGTGSLITSWSVNRNVVDWQLRHGTKRRNSRFWLP